jgi:hypothetical protein
MKTLITLVTLTAFLAFGAMAFAQEKAPVKPTAEKKAEKTVNCCVKGECKQVANKGECDKLKGSVVKDCAKCK